MILNYDIAVDLTPEFNKLLSPKFSVSLGDHGSRQYMAKILQSGEPYEIAENSLVSIVGKKPDGHIFAYDCTYSDEYVYFTIEEQMTPVAGIVTCELSIIDASDNKVGSANFTYWVEPSPVTDGEASESDLQIFQQAIDAAAEIRDDVDAMVSTFGGPNVAETAAEMTDTKKVYVYTGSETGYTYGHWYYYDKSDSVWKSGGVYQSQGVVTDKTLTVNDVPADAEATGDALALKANTADVASALSHKQDTLTFDMAPTQESTNPVTSGGVYAALEEAKDDAQTAIEDVREESEEVTAETREIALKAFATPTASGALLTLTDGADGIPVKTLTLNLTPHQSGSGDPSPDNVRSISGYTAVKVTRAGKNLASVPDTVFTMGDVRAKTFNNPITLPPGVYTASATLENSTKTKALTVAIRYSETGNDNIATLVFGAAESGRKSVTFTSDRPIDRFYAYLSTSEEEGKGGTLTNFMLEAGSTVTDYAEYITPTEYDIALPTAAGTVYGGSLEINDDGTGTLTVDKVYTTITSAVDFVGFYTASNRVKRIVSGGVFPAGSHAIACDKYKTFYTQGIPSDTTLDAIALTTEGRIVITSSLIQSAANVEEAKTALFANGDIAFVYQTPNTTVYTLTAEQVTTLLGSNTVWMDADGTIDLTYRADTTLYINNLITGIRNNIAYIEDGMTASRAYTVGQFVLIGGQLYRVTASIASGATFTPGTNVVATTVGTELTALN